MILFPDSLLFVCAFYEIVVEPPGPGVLNSYKAWDFAKMDLAYIIRT